VTENGNNNKEKHNQGKLFARILRKKKGEADIAINNSRLSPSTPFDHPPGRG
jgi:hypothetical protein